MEFNDGYVILKPQFSQSPFNEGLPSWNGSAANLTMDLKFRCDFHIMHIWSPMVNSWVLEIKYIGVYGSKPSYGGGYIDYDNVKLNSYQSSWQFKIIMKRTSAVSRITNHT